MANRLRFHWSLSSAGESLRGALPRAAQSGVPDLETLAAFCRLAERCGIEMVLTAFGFHRPDPIVLATALGMRTERIKFLVAVRSGVSSPTAFVQQVNSVAAVTAGRIALNVVAGHSPEEQRAYGDFLNHDQRYQRTDEFLAICHAVWRGERDITFAGKYYRVEKSNLNTPFVSARRLHPEIYIAGNSPPAQRLALARGTCWMRLGDTAENVRRAAADLLDRGIEVGLRMSMIARPTRAEAVAAARNLIERLGTGRTERTTEGSFIQRSDSVSMTDLYRRAEEEWLAPTLWAGAVRTHGAAALALVGSPDEIAAVILEYKRTGVSQFIFSGWPKVESMEFFGREILPIIRRMERCDPREPAFRS